MATAPIGTIIAYAGPVTPAWEVNNGWLLCDGRPLDRTRGDTANPSSPYQPLFNAIGSSWGGDGVNRFHVPDLQGRFLRGVDQGTGRDPDAGARTQSNAGGHAADQVGTLQLDQYGSHAHGVTDPGHVHTFGVWVEQGAGGIGAGFPRDERPAGTNPAATGIAIQNSGGQETRPRNASVYWLIRYK